MSLDLVDAGREVPENFNVVIEIPMNAEPVKYEVDKETGAIFVDRVLTTPMRYPCNYGYVPRTLSGDGDPVDVLVVMPLPLVPGCVIRSWVTRNEIRCGPVLSTASRVDSATAFLKWSPVFFALIWSLPVYVIGRSLLRSTRGAVLAVWIAAVRVKLVLR